MTSPHLTPFPSPPFPLGPVSSPVQAFLRPKTHLTGPARPGQPPLAGPAGPISTCLQTLDWKMEALKGWLQLQGAGLSAGLLEVSGKTRQLTADSQRFVQQQFSTLVDQCQFSNLAKQCQQFLVKLSQEVRQGHLPLEYLIVGGDLHDFSFRVQQSDFFLGLMCSLDSLGDLKVRPSTLTRHQPSILSCRIEL